MMDSLRDKETVIREFASHYSFTLDDFQHRAIKALADGHSALVAAPTGTGKTVVAEFGVYLARLRGQRVMYTTPVKALSNQKFRDFRTMYGDAVGLLTGDVVENRSGQIIVMTTEVLRNMILQTPEDLADVGLVIFDEVHYLADPERGTTWEESIVLAPKHLQLVCLSATVSNAADLATWITLVHRPTQLIEHYTRAVPLLHHYFLDNQLCLVLDEEQHQVTDFPNVGGEARRRVRSGWMVPEDEQPASRRRAEPDPIQIVQRLEHDDMLPAIYFLFSRRDCEAAADVCAMIRLRITRDPTKVREIGQIVQSHLDRLSPEDRRLDQVTAIVRLAQRGFGYHHAGLLPMLKQLVEELFSKGLMGVVFATDTLALGINMPARSVVVGRMSKFDGQSRRPLVPNEFQQMAGRAGRRGIDPRGHVVIPYSPWMPFREAIAIAAGHLYPVQSSFTLRYNTVLNLWDPPSGQRVLQMHRDSLMQFQLAHQTRDLAQKVQQIQHTADALPRGCLIGYADGETLLSEYEALNRTKAAQRHEKDHFEREEQRIEERLRSTPWPRPTREQLRKAFRLLPSGTVVHLETEGTRLLEASRGSELPSQRDATRTAFDAGWVVFLGQHSGGHVGLFLFGDRADWLANYRAVDYLPAPPTAVTLPAGLQSLKKPISSVSTLASVEEWRRLNEQLAAAGLPDLEGQAAAYRSELEADLAAEIALVRNGLASSQCELRELQQRIAGHVCDPCPVRKQHRRNLRQVALLMDDKAEAEHDLAAHMQFEEKQAQRVLGAIVSVLHQFGYLKRGYPTAKAAQLANIFDANGLLVAEALGAGWLYDLGSEDLAEVFSWFAYDRDVELANRYLLPRHLVRLRRDLDELQGRIWAAERRNDLTLTTGYNYYFFGMARAWCHGETLAEILGKVNLGEGDLVMAFNKTIDLLRQVDDMLAQVVHVDPLREKLQRAQQLMRRGIIEQSLSLGLQPF